MSTSAQNRSPLMFELTATHIRIIKRLNFGLGVAEEHNGCIIPTIDRKKPFGNSDILGDVCELMGFKAGKNGFYTEKEINEAKNLICELPLALHTILTRYTFIPGTYEIDREDAICEISHMVKMKNYLVVESALNEINQDEECQPYYRQIKSYLMSNNCADDPWHDVDMIEQACCEHTKAGVKKAINILRKHRNAQLAERQPYKLDVAGSKPVCRSPKKII